MRVDYDSYLEKDMRYKFDGFEYKTVKGYIKIMELCGKFMDEFSKKSKSYNNTVKLGRLLVIIEKICKKLPNIPEGLKDSNVFMEKGRIGFNALHDMVALDYVTEVFIEAMTQRDIRMLPSDAYCKKYFGDGGDR